jgi:T5orf172 domain
MKESGNGTAAIQKIYIMWNLPYFHVVKVGITGNVGNRRKNISETTPGLVFPIFVVVVPFAYWLEKKMHGWFSWFNMPFGSSASGGSEWFIFVVAPFAAVIMAVFQVFWLCLSVVVTLLFLWLGSGCPDEPVEALARLIF